MPAEACQSLMAHHSLHSLRKNTEKAAKPLSRPLFSYCFFSDFINWFLQVLADYIGQQPVSSSGTVQVLPPWRSDGRCGPQFPVGKAPGECDPYGGALNLHKFTFRNFLHLFFLDMFLFNLSPVFFQRTIFFSPLQTCKVLHVVLPRAGVVARRISANAPAVGAS